MQRPRQLITISVVTMVLGGMGIVLSISGLQQWLIGQFSGVVPVQGNREFFKLQQQMLSELAAATAPWRRIAIPILIAILATSALSILGGFQTLHVRPLGRRLLLVLFWLLIPLDMVRMIINIIVGHKTSDIMIRHMVKIAGAGSTPPPPFVDSWISGISSVGIYIGLILGLLWGIAKITFYVLALKYFRRPDIVHLFETKQMIPPPLPPANKRWD